VLTVSPQTPPPARTAQTDSRPTVAA
jgi:hypothetical protein